ncbi:glycosyltransferase family 2 protein [Candidatus Pelagibacter bacterium nBUS_49]|uniref:glycosyltransferase family 2 protein n=1 Tax=Candidatus Pelagibacter bacterium nBUS_49 TaxID=3374196 RepID=UPI003EBA21D1
MLQFYNTKILSFPRSRKIIQDEKFNVRKYKGFNLINLKPELKKISQKIINRKKISNLDYYKTISSLHGYDFILYNEIIRNKKISKDLSNFRKKNKHISYLENRCHPFSKQDDKILILTTNIDRKLIDFLLSEYQKDQIKIVLTTPRDLKLFFQKIYKRTDTKNASELLHIREPKLSAKKVFSLKLTIFLLSLIGTLVTCGYKYPAETSFCFAAFCTCVFLINSSFRVWLFVVAIYLKFKNRYKKEIPILGQKNLPTYSILIPIYKETEVLKKLIKNISALKYPKKKLDVKLIFEEEDLETIELAKKLNPPHFFEFIIVPKSYPQTKPKACNYALTFCRGEYVCIYDAEDKPETDQLLKAVAKFRSLPDDYVCLQASLNYYNQGYNYLTRLFSLEYAQWFDWFLPGLNKFKSPIPLGGTSNHFKRKKLYELYNWDSYNVTEDADLGVRIYQKGFKTTILNSTTWEEATGSKRAWIKQRTRWIKGHMITVLIHNRNPFKFLWRTGLRGFAGFHLFLTLPLINFLINPFAILQGFFLLTSPDYSSWVGFGDDLLTYFIYGILLYNLSNIFMSMVAGINRKFSKLYFILPLVPIYWMLHSYAAFIGLFEVITKPHYWAKTTHGKYLT